jgi:hypothetical protein
MKMVFSQNAGRRSTLPCDGVPYDGRCRHSDTEVGNGPRKMYSCVFRGRPHLFHDTNTSFKHAGMKPIQEANRMPTISDTAAF